MFVLEMLCVTAIPISIYLAFKRPWWFISFALIFPVLYDIGMVAQGLTDEYALVYLGPIGIRATDPVAAGLVLGLASALPSRKRLGRLKTTDSWPFLLICSYILLKVISSTLQGVPTGIGNQLGGGVVAALGEARDAFLPLLFPLYFAMFIDRDSIRGGFLFMAATAGSAILLRTLAFVLATGAVWGIDPEYRYIRASDAISLTIVGFFLLMVPCRNEGKKFPRWLGAFLVILATLANHRSQWLGLLLGSGAYLMLYALGVGRDISVRTKIYYISFAMILLPFFILLTPLETVEQFLKDNSEVAVRLRALTDYEQDDDSSWRYQLWTARVNYVGRDWLSGRQLGDRRPVILHNTVVTVPNHSTYVTLYELGGALMCSLYFVAISILVKRTWKRLLARNSSPFDRAFLNFSVVSIICLHGWMIAYDMYSMLGIMIGVLLVHLASSGVPVRVATRGIHPSPTFPALNNQRYPVHPAPNLTSLAASQPSLFSKR